MHLTEYSDRHLVKIILDVIKRDARLEYIDSSQYHLSKNHVSTNETSELLTADVEKQLTANRLLTLQTSLSDSYICSFLELVSKFDES